MNEAGKSFRAVGAGRFGPMQEGKRPGGPSGKKKERLVDLEKVVFRKEDTMLVLGRELRLEEVKGPGKRCEVWWTEG